MEFGILLILQVIAFSFLALGIVPFTRTREGGNLPLVNKIMFVFVAAILFFSLSAVAATYERVYCYEDEYSVSNNITTFSSSTCDVHLIENIGLSYLNLGMGILSILIGFMILIITLSSRFDDLNNEE